MATSHEPRKLCQAPHPDWVDRIQALGSNRYPAEPVPRHGTPLRPGERKYHAECRENARNERRRTPKGRAGNADGVQRWRLKHAPSLRTVDLIRRLVFECSGRRLQISEKRLHERIRGIYRCTCPPEVTPQISGYCLVTYKAVRFTAYLIRHRGPCQGRNGSEASASSPTSRDTHVSTVPTDRGTEHLERTRSTSDHTQPGTTLIAIRPLDERLIEPDKFDEAHALSLEITGPPLEPVNRPFVTLFGMAGGLNCSEEVPQRRVTSRALRNDGLVTIGLRLPLKEGGDPELETC